MTTDNRTNEPTPEQVEAAAKALYANKTGSERGFEHTLFRRTWLQTARIALVAAAGVAPQAESAQPWNDEADPNSPRFDSPWEKAAALLSTLRGAQFDLLTRRDPVEVQDEVNGLINRLDELVAAMLAAPAQPSSTAKGARHE